MKLRKSLPALLVAVLMLFGTTAFAAEANTFTKGKRGTWYAYTWSGTVGRDNLYQPFMLHTASNKDYIANMRGDGPLVTARRMKAYFDTIPDGRRALNPFSLYAPIRDLDNKIAGNFYWPDESYDQVCRELDEILYYYNRLGGKPIDAFTSDLESGMSIWNLEAFQTRKIMTLDEIFDRITADPRYETELKPSIVEAGITLYEGDDHNELYNMYANRNVGDANDPIKADVYRGVVWAFERTAQYLNRVYDVLKKYYPDIKCSDYDCSVENKPEQITNTYGHMYGLFTNPLPEDKNERNYNGIMGTHSSWNNYGDVQAGLTNNPPPDYPYDTYQNSPYNGILFQIIKMQSVVTYRDDSKMQPWVGAYTYGYQNKVSFVATDYYDEMIYQFAVGNPDPFLYFNTTANLGIDNDAHFSELLYDLDDLVGFEDRKTLITDLTPWDSHYILNGMYAGGKNVWRITPDLFVEGMTIENFKVKDNPLTFQIAEQIVEFPEGSYIYDPGPGHSKAGYWVISPEGTRPVEYRDSSIAPAKQPMYVWENGAEILKQRVADILGATGAEDDAFPKDNLVVLPIFDKSYRELFKTKK